MLKFYSFKVTFSRPSFDGSGDWNLPIDWLDKDPGYVTELMRYNAISWEMIVKAESLEEADEITHVWILEELHDRHVAPRFSFELTDSWEASDWYTKGNGRYYFDHGGYDHKVFVENVEWLGQHHRNWEHYWVTI